jgi:hypothetical protein
MSNKNQISADQKESLILTLQNRFEKHLHRHQGIDFSKIHYKLEKAPEKVWSLNQMEATGGEPDVVDYDETTDEYVFFDCSAESPKGRRSVCYDHQALNTRKEHKPKNSAVGMASQMGIDLLNEEQFRQLQQFGQFDTKTSSWLLTPDGIRTRGGAIFGDWRYGRVFIYHNGAESYYGSRGFRGSLRV